MLLGFSYPEPDDWQIHTVPKSEQMVCTVINTQVWAPNNDSGFFEHGMASTGWRAQTEGFAECSLLIPVLVGTAVDGSGQSLSPWDPAGASNPTVMTMDDVANGMWDALFTAGFQNINTYRPDAILRIGNEWFGSAWYAWNGPALGVKGRAVFRHLTDLARAVNPNFRTEWLAALDLSSAAGYSMQNIVDFYPGDDYVDFMSADVYDAATQGKYGSVMWDLRASQMAAPLAFAKAHGKPYCITEWGLYNVAQIGIGNDDDPAFIQGAYKWMRANEPDLGWATYFNGGFWDGRLQDNPQSEGMYKALFVPWARQLAGETTHRFVTPGFGPIDAVSPVGSFARATGTALRTLAVTPQTVGNVLVLSILNRATANTVTAVSGGGVTTWTNLVRSNPGTNQGASELWFGPVTTQGAATVTITVSSVSTTILGCQEFTVDTPAVWTADVTAFSTATTQNASGNYPSVTPTGVNELYVGASHMLGGGIAGQSAGFSYFRGTVSFEPNAQFVYKAVASNPTAQSPAWTQVSNYWSAVSGLLIATPITPGAGAHRLRL